MQINFWKSRYDNANNENLKLKEKIIEEVNLREEINTYYKNAMESTRTLNEQIKKS